MNFKEDRQGFIIFRTPGLFANRISNELVILSELEWKKNMENKLDIVQEENLCELVWQFPVIFDKSHKGHKEKDAEVNAWSEIANSLDFIPDGMYCILAAI